MTDKADLWVSKFPHPGDAPSKPKRGFDPAVHEYNKWVTAMRKHNIARSVDTLIVAEAGQGAKALTPAETIALTVGLMILDGSIRDSPDGLFGLFF